MTNIHLITSVYVGGQTGKSTTCLMLAAYLTSIPKARTISIIDMSFDAALFSKLKNLFQVRSLQLIRGHDAFVCESSEGNGQRLIVLKPRETSGRELPTTDLGLMVKTFHEMRSGILDRFGGEQDSHHFIFETNLPQEAVTAGHFMEELLGGRSSKIPIHLWTLWNTSGLTQKNLYEIYHIFPFSVPNLTLHYVHNPFSTDARQWIEPFSEAMRSCFYLPPGTSGSAEDLWRVCGDPAKRFSNLTSSYEEIWEKAYQYFQQSGNRPLNVLPIFQYSNTWKQVLQNEFREIYCANLSALESCISDNSDGLYKEVYKEYFQQNNI